MFLNNDKFLKAAEKLDEIFKDIDKYSRVYQIKREQAEKEVLLFSRCKDMASLGNKGARDYVINQYTKMLSTDLFNLDGKNVNSLINFIDIFQNNVQIIFEMLLKIYDISWIIDNYNLNYKITKNDIIEIAKNEGETIKEEFDSLIEKLRLIAVIIYSREYGQDCIDTLQHNDINEIGIIDKNYIYIVYKGNKYHLEFLSFDNKEVILNIQKKTTRKASKNYDEQNPTLIASKDNSNRITVAGYAATPTDEDLYYNERIFNLKKITLEEMRDHYKTINELIYKLLIINQKGRGSHFITGPDMGVGKSTFLLAMMEKVPNNWGIGILDTQNELQAKKKYPWKNILTLIENPKRSISQCFEVMLKMTRDVIYVGEITQPSEVAELVNASMRLNSGVGATMHSKSAYEVVTNLRNLMMRTQMYNNFKIAESDISRGLDIIIHLEKIQNGRIVVANIVEVEYINEEYKRNILTGDKYSLKQKASNLIDMMQLGLEKYLYGKSYKYNTIITYENDIWKPVNMPSDKYFNKLLKYVDKHEIQEFKDFFIKQKNKLTCVN